jgi:membrane-bound metal-dependent hydrolase YbcI (DUF457 family)
MGKTHAWAGAAACSLVAVTYWSPTVGTLAAGIVLCAGTGVANDIDHPDSTVEQALGPVTWLLSKVVRTLTGGVPRRTHSIPIAALATLLAWWQVDWYRHVPTMVLHHAVPARGVLHAIATVWLGLTLTILISAAIRALTGHAMPTLAGHAARAARHIGLLADERSVRSYAGHFADFFGIGFALAALHTGFGLQLLVPAVAFGMGVHILLDSMTTDGVPVLYPFSTWELHLFGPFRFKTNHYVEHGLRWALIAGTFYLLLIDAGAWKGLPAPAFLHQHLHQLLTGRRT